MNLPINIDDLLNAKTVEWERLEFKEGWNPDGVLRSLCAFANDFHNLGGGYIVLGVAEKDGRPVFPPRGLSSKDIDRIQKEIVALGHRIHPDYHPIIFPTVYQKKNILVLWAVAGLVRPYKAPISLSEKNKGYRYYIRKGSVTVAAKDQDEKELLGMAATVPFDDRPNRSVEIEKLDLGLIRAYLQQVGSDLFEEVGKIDFLQLCRSMNLADGPNEHVRPKNVGLMFFNSDPQKYFPQAQIDVVHFPEGLGADDFTEKIFKGPVHIMLREALAYIEGQVIKEKVHKRSDRPEADRFYNYSYPALKEAICNAVYHRSYEIREPVEVRVLPDSITINSFPGPDRSISAKDIKSLKLASHRCLNRRVGEFLKELELTEGRGTGIPKMIKALKKNESPLPVFHTDKHRSFLMVEFPIHLSFLEKNIGEEKVVKNRTNTSQMSGKYHASTMQVPSKLNVLQFCVNSRSLKEIIDHLGLKNRMHVLVEYVRPLVDDGQLALTIPDKPRSSRQKYVTTENGRKNLGA